MVATLRRAFGLVERDRRRRFGVVALFAVIVSLLEAASALLVLVVLRLVLDPGSIPDVPLIGDPSRFFPGASYEQLVLGFSAGFGVFFLVRAAAFVAQQYAVARVAENTGVSLAHRLLDGYLSMPYEFHLSRNSAQLVRNAHNNVNQLVAQLYKPAATVVAESVLVLVMLAVLLAISPLATLAAVATLGGAVVVTFLVIQPRLKRLGRQRQDAIGAALQHLQQGLGGVRDIKILGRERTFSKSFRGARRGMARAQYRQEALSASPRVAIETAFLGFVLLVLVVAVLTDSVSGIVSTLGLFAYAGMRLQPSLQKIADGLNKLRYSEAIVSDLGADLEVLETTLARRDREDTDVAPLPFEQAVVFDRVSYRYSETAGPALRDIDLTIRRGESIGVAGHTGGGKSTLLDLLCGLLLPTEGVIAVDGVDVSTRVRAWQRNIGVVHQSSFLIDDTLRRNIAFGTPDAEIDHAAVAAAAEAAELGDVLEGLAEGFDTVVGERGVRLSGGQRQRVTLARALYRQPRLLVLDEGTSALDNATEARVIANIAGLREDLTLVMVAHRLTTIMRCDRIVFLEDGQMTGLGSYEELKREHPSFRAMAV